MENHTNEVAFPTLTDAEVSQIKPLGEEQVVEDGTLVFRAGQPNLDLFIVLDGALEITNPGDGDRRVALHMPGHFAGDIDLLTRRPVVVNAKAVGRTRLLRVPGDKVREVLLRLPQISEKLLRAFQERRALLSTLGNIGLKLYGPAECAETNLIREFLDKNFVPFVWFKSTADSAPEGEHGPMIDCGNGVVLYAPTLQEVARCAGVWQECPVSTVDLVIIGAGPAGMSAAVYAASEGIETLVLDGLGPGGQAAASSKIENFIGFPSGLSGTELATRAVIQMLKFGAQIVAPVHVTSLELAHDDHSPHMLHLDCGSVVRANNVFVASGLKWRHLDALGTDRFDNAGVYYACTTTETVMHQGQSVAVVGAGNSAGQAAMFLAEQCATTVHLLMRGDDLNASMSSYLVERIRATDNIEVHKNTEITDIIADDRLKGVEICGPSGERSTLLVNALFVFIGAEPEVDWLPKEVARDAKGYLLTGADTVMADAWPLGDRAPCSLETSVPRVFAVGDVRSGSTKRVGFAVGDGALACACLHSLRSQQTARPVREDATEHQSRRQPLAVGGGE
jgi:thioredoxin reductase (NADPH)